jgi:hypothetical protein
MPQEKLLKTMVKPVDYSDGSAKNYYGAAPNEFNSIANNPVGSVESVTKTTELLKEAKV